tara:strand:+ start:73724 stop:74287 length:564 start_codon:yes stop_codon:yes gene_type:complete
MRKTLTQQVHERLTKIICPGDGVVDATVGNGHDTAFLAEAVGPEGRVFGFDVQQSAIDATSVRLEAAGVREWVDLFLNGHECLLDFLPAEFIGRVKVIMFNLGYLPGSDKQVITQTETTLQAIQAALICLAQGGCLSVLLYPGHPGGSEEAHAVKAFLKSLPQEAYLLEIEGGSGTNAPESLILTKV